MLLDWNTADRRHLTARYDAGPGRFCRLGVEQLDGANWDWTIWCAQDPSAVLHGVARGRTEAMAAAERALPDLRCRCWRPSAGPEDRPVRPRPARQTA